MQPDQTRFQAIAARWRARFRYVPDEPEAFGFEMASIAGRFFIDLPVLGGALKFLGRYCSQLLEAMSPAMPLDVEANNSFSKDPLGFYWNIFKYTFPITVLFCYGLNAYFSLRSDTLLPTGVAGRIPFLTDGYNALLYLVVCPIYVSSAVCLLVTTAISWRTLHGSYDRDAPATGRKALSNATRLTGFLTVSLLITGFYTAEYISDLANPETVTSLYWFFDDKLGQRVLNKAGIYYVFLNATLLFITAMAAFCYIAISIEMFGIGKNISRSVFFLEPGQAGADFDKILSEKEEKIRRTLSDFSYSYIMAKLLVFAYAVNITIWQISPAGQVKNVHSAIIAVMIIGIVFLIIPRLYLNSKWHRLKIEFVEAAGEAARTAPGVQDRIEFQDLRAREYRRAAMLLNIGYGFLLAVILASQYGVNFLDVGGMLAEAWRDFWFPEEDTPSPAPTAAQ